ncbi:MAG: NUDIX domain-containing protein [Chlorobi bacterium]|nr:NUDIX domain-containing protein [Chlorobiota bacterium]
MSEDINTRFTIRVYGIIMDSSNRILLSDESYMKHRFTKFPGGGLEYGEGTIDCLKREMLEETGCRVEVLKHIYTTDFFQESEFHSGMQVISIYYLVRLNNPECVKVSEKPYDFSEDEERGQSFRWVAFENLTPEDVTLPIDKVVVGILGRQLIELAE